MPRAMTSSAAAIPLLVLLIGAAGLFAGMGIDILIWALITRHLLCRPRLRRARVPSAPTPPTSTLLPRGATSCSRISSAGSAGPTSHPWAAALARSTSSPSSRRSCMLLAIAATALIASAQRGALIVTFALPVAVYAYAGIKPWVTVEAIMVGLAGPVAAVLFLCRRPSQQIGADAAVLPHREGRADRRARDREVDVGRGAPPRRGGQPRQVALPGLDEPRAADAAQRHPRLLGSDGQRGAGADGQPDLSRLCQATSTIPGSICST